MKLVFAVLSLVGVSASACPHLSPGVYTEVAVGCMGNIPDYRFPVAVNQMDPINRGECRVQVNQGESFMVRGRELVLVEANGTSTSVGVLQEQPTCYQWDSDVAYTSDWTEVRLKF